MEGGEQVGEMCEEGGMVEFNDTLLEGSGKKKDKSDILCFHLGNWINHEPYSKSRIQQQRRLMVMMTSSSSTSQVANTSDRFSRGVCGRFGVSIWK